MFLLTHIFCCMWYYSARMEFYKGKTWISNLLGEDYLTCFYWATQTITVEGYGDIIAIYFWDYIVVVIWELIGVGFYSFAIGSLATVFE